MTAVPGDGSGFVTLICDGCGTTADTADVLHEDEVVWASVTAIGWTGSPFATGPHRCPACAAGTPREPRRGRPPAPRPADDAFETRTHDRVRAVVIAPRADLDEQITGLVRPALMAAAAAGRNIVVDLKAAGSVDSAGLGLLVRGHREARHHGGTLVLAAPSRFVLTVLHTMRLDGMFPIYPDRRQALAALRDAGRYRLAGPMTVL